MIRDKLSNALISTDDFERDKYRIEKKKTMQLLELQQDVATLKEQIKHILKLLEERV